MSSRSAIVIGAGIGGLTSALALAKDGWSVSIFERAAELVPVGAGLQIPPNACRVLDDLGLLESVASVSLAPEALQVRAGTSGNRLGGMELGEAAIRRWGAPFLLSHRGDLQSALLAAASAQPAITITLGHGLDALRFREASIEARLIHASGDMRAEADLLVAADGLWSKARSLIGLPGPTNFSGCVAWRALVPAEAVPAILRAPCSNLWLGAGAHVVHYPLREGRDINIVAIVEQDWRETGWSEPGDPAWIRARFGAWHQDLRALIASAQGWQRWSLHDRPPEARWTRGHAALLGDAAHPMLPFLAQGAAQAIEDAGALAKALREQPDVEAALKVYQNRRRSRAARVQSLSRQQARIYHAGAPISLVRDFGMALLGETGLAKRYDWLYGNSA